MSKVVYARSNAHTHTHTKVEEKEEEASSSHGSTEVATVRTVIHRTHINDGWIHFLYTMVRTHTQTKHLYAYIK